MSKFDYPWLRRREIVMVLAESQIATVSEADLLRPDSDFVNHLYTLILLHMDILLEDQEQMEFGALEQIENPDYHSHAIQIMNLFNKIRQLLAAIACPKLFTPRDLIKPEPDRLELFLGSLLNFHLHRQMKLNLLKPTVEDLNILEQRQADNETRISQLKEEIADFEELREKELPLVQEVNTKVEELSQSIAGLNKHQMNLKTSIKQLKEKDKEMDEKISNAEFALVQSAQENASLRSKIVQSPDKLQRALEEKRLVQIEAKNAERAVIQTFQDKTAMLEAHAKACKKVSKHFDQMQTLQEQVNSAKSVEKEVKVLKSKLSDDGVMIKSLEAKLVELQSKADQLKESKRQLEKDRAILHEETDKELTKVRLEVVSKKHALELRQRQVEAVVAEADAITSKKKAVMEEAEATTQKLDRESEEIAVAFDNYSTWISNLIAEAGYTKLFVG